MKLSYAIHTQENPTDIKWNIGNEYFCYYIEKTIFYKEVLKIAWENKYEFCNSYLKHIFYTKYNVAIFHLIKGGS